jgi:hypothetical protein
MDKEIFINSIHETLPISRENVISVMENNDGSIEKGYLLDRFSGNHPGSLRGVLRNEDIEASVKIWDILADVAELEIKKSKSSAWVLKRSYISSKKLTKPSGIKTSSITENLVLEVLCSLGGKATTAIILRNLSGNLIDENGKIDEDSLGMIFTILGEIATKTFVEETSVMWKLKC